MYRKKTIQHFNDPGHAHFLTFSCYRQLPLLSRERTRRWVIEAIAGARKKHHFALFAYVIMPEHIHLIIFPLEADYDVALILKAIKQSVARKAKHFLENEHLDWWKKLTVPRGKRQVFRFWQTGPGYDRNITDEMDFLEKINYIHENPVKRGLVPRPEAWEWSSAGWYSGKRDGALEIDSVAWTNSVCP